MKVPASLRAGLVLAGFVGVGLAAVALVYEQTHERISAAERQVVLDRLEAVLPHEYDNAPEEAAYRRPTPVPGGEPLRIFPAFSGDTFTGTAVEVTTPEGYSGTIRLLIGLDPEGRILGVRTVAHRETPGLGDAIEADRSDWIHGFDGHSLDNPPEPQWRVAQDGGEFDGITGATITARAVIDAVREVLVDFAADPNAYRGVEEADDGEPAPLDGAQTEGPAQ